MAENKMVILCGPSGSGKTTLAHQLLKVMPNLSFSISATTRSMRPNEVNGVDYHFLSVEEFRDRIHKDEFVEHEQVYDGLYYGTLKSEIDKIWKGGKVPVLDIDVLGARSIKQRYPEALVIFVHPVSIENLQSRLKQRATENDESYQKRISRAEHELTFSHEFDKVIYNDNLERAITEAEQYVSGYLE